MLIIIAAVDENRAIGNKGGLLFDIPEDMEFFKKRTYSSTVIMGRKTYDSLRIKPLPNRNNIILSRSLDDDLNVNVCKNLNELFEKLGDINGNAYVIGGESVYKALMPYCHKALITEIFARSDCADAFFPNFKTGWILSARSEIYTSKAGIRFRFCEYVNTDPKKFKNKKLDSY